MSDAPRKPAVFSLDEPFIEHEADVLAVAVQEPPEPRPRRFRFGTWLIGALGGLVSLSIGLWLNDWVVSLYARNDWLGSAVIGLTVVAGVTLFGLIGQEIGSLWRLKRVASLQARGARVESLSDAQTYGRELIGFYAHRLELAEARKVCARHLSDILDPADVLRLIAEDLLGPLDAQARRAISDAAKRVSLVTTLSPRALIDVGFVIYAALTLIGKIARIYGVRPSGIGFVRLLRQVIEHLAVTGTLAFGDGLAQQFLGHGVAAKISSRLGEGVINGLLTARIGLATIEVCRPMAFSPENAPKLADLVPGVFGAGEAKMPGV